MREVSKLSGSMGNSPLRPSIKCGGIVNLSGRGMLLVPVARQLGSGNSFARLSCCPAHATPPAKQDAPNPPSSNPPAQQEGPVFDVPRDSGLSGAQQPARSMALDLS